jgi:hypothetical protein
VFAANRLPPITRYPSALIANTQPDTHSGEHWIAMFFDHYGNADYFCSYAEPPSQAFVDYLRKNARSWQRTNRRIQGPLATTCGQYCVAFLHFRSRDVSLRDFLRLFTDIDNDTIVVAFINGLYDANTRVLEFY